MTPIVTQKASVMRTLQLEPSHFPRNCGKGNHVAQQERERQRRAAFLLTTQGDAGGGT